MAELLNHHGVILTEVSSTIQPFSHYAGCFAPDEGNRVCCLKIALTFTRLNFIFAN
jgi:hypothetical protein